MSAHRIYCCCDKFLFGVKFFSSHSNTILLFQGNLCLMQLLKELNEFTVVERDGSVIACAALFPFLKEKSGEIAAFAVSPECRGHGRGDTLLGMSIPTCFEFIVTSCPLLETILAFLMLKC